MRENVKQRACVSGQNWQCPEFRTHAFTRLFKNLNLAYTPEPCASFLLRVYFLHYICYAFICAGSVQEGGTDNWREGLMTGTGALKHAAFPRLFKKLNLVSCDTG